MSSPQVIIFDVDGTLVEPWTAELLPGRASRLQQLHQAGKQIYLATNQGGPAYHLAMRLLRSSRAAIYPNLMATLKLLETLREEVNSNRCYVALHPGNQKVIEKLQEHTVICEDERISYYSGKVVCCWSAQWRKPQQGMIKAIMDKTFKSNRHYLFIGNDETDLQASRRANISYLDANQFFNPNYTPEFL